MGSQPTGGETVAGQGWRGCPAADDAGEGESSGGGSTGGDRRGQGEHGGGSDLLSPRPQPVFTTERRCRSSPLPATGHAVSHQGRGRGGREWWRSEGSKRSPSVQRRRGTHRGVLGPRRRQHALGLDEENGEAIVPVAMPPPQCPLHLHTHRCDAATPTSTSTAATPASASTAATPASVPTAAVPASAPTAATPRPAFASAPTTAPVDAHRHVARPCLRHLVAHRRSREALAVRPQLFGWVFWV
uniref:Uncharacterized protein n=1 Tax=Oryza sativa subsp. japonica TaxID=39947 RepID=Q6Z531_ORYSJ|nr:hypothetical protein [Oryza sativa Japonica Group]